MIGRFPTTSHQGNNNNHNNNNNHHHHKRETKRRIQHAMTGHSIVLLSYILSSTMLRYGQFLLFVIIIIIYYIHQYHFHTIYMKIAGPYLRPLELISDHHNCIVLPGAYYFLCGVWITSLLFPLYITQYSVMCLSYSDPMASYIGQTIPSRRLIDLISSYTTAENTRASYSKQTTTTTTRRRISILTSSAATLSVSVSYHHSSLVLLCYTDKTILLYFVFSWVH
jgi:hypothetical protein